MANLKDDGQWIITLGFIISVLILFLALIVNQSILVGKTTSESVLEFPKISVQDLRAEVLENELKGANVSEITGDLHNLSIYRKNALVLIEKNDTTINIHYNDGQTIYNEVYQGG
jgi:hypothetical protein